MSSIAIGQTSTRRAEKPTHIDLRNGSLTVQANNSSVRQILQQISRESGMVIDGPIPDDAVFGTYGPGNPAVVISDLLDGLGYNILMTGSARDGAPHSLLLTPRTGSASPPSAATYTAVTSTMRATPAGSTNSQPNEPELGPGAIAHPHPEPTTDDPQARTQQNLNRLRQMQEARQKATLNQ